MAADGGEERRVLSRRGLLGGAAASLGAAALAGCAGGGAGQRAEPGPVGAQAGGEGKAGIRAFRALGRTGFQVSDIGLGCGNLAEANVVRYAFDQGVNYLDTAESYGNGDSERKIGEALQALPRDKLFVTTKLQVKPEDTEATLLDRFQKCQERLRTPYVDALSMHAVGDPASLGHAGFHAAVARLKADGRLRFAGLSSHGPHGQSGVSMAEVLLAAVADGRFDLMLLVYSFLNFEEGARVLAACKEKNIGTTGMKALAGVLEVPPFDPERPTGEYAEEIDEMLKRGRTREEAVARVRMWVQESEEARDKTRPYLERWGVKAEDELHKKSLQWALGNPDLHCVCVSMKDFDLVDRYVPLSGQPLGAQDRGVLDAYARGAGRLHCRHNCAACATACPAGLPVATIMRYAYYFALQGRQKEAMAKYVRLGARSAAACAACDAPCRGACPYGAPIQANLVRAHQLLRLA